MNGQTDSVKIETQLRSLGYLSPPTGAESNGALPRALREFQVVYKEAYGLQETGQADPRTSKTLLQPKCGCEDGNQTRGLQPSAERLAAANTAREAGVLLYAFESSTSDLNDQARAQTQVRLAFKTWQSLGKVSFREAKPREEPDIIIRWVDATRRSILQGDAIAVADFPNSGRHPQVLEFDDSEVLWVDGEALNGFDIQSVALHEIGHLLGLDHVQDPDAVMHFSFQPNRANKRGLRAADIAAFRALFP